MLYKSVILDNSGRRENVPLGGRFVFNAARLLGYDSPFVCHEYYDLVDYRDTDVLSVDADEFRAFSRDIFNAACDVLEVCVHGEDAQQSIKPRLRLLFEAVRDAEE